jgi:hypothetical protein
MSPSVKCCLLVLLASSASAFSPITLPATARIARNYRSLATSTRMAVSRKDSYDITLLPGDGIGPEIISAAVVACKVGILNYPIFGCYLIFVMDFDFFQAVAAKQGFKINFKEALIGGAGDHF